MTVRKAARGAGPPAPPVLFLVICVVLMIPCVSMIPCVAHAAATGQGLISIVTNADDYVPGALLDVRYSTKPGTLQGPVDLYFAVFVPWGQVLFLTEGGEFGPGFLPFRRQVTLADETLPLFSFPVPVDLPFGIYTCFAGLAYAGTDASDTKNWASPIASVELSHAPLSPAQTALLAARGRKPDLLAISWFPESFQKRETWIYLGGGATKFVFLNGNLTGEAPTSAGGTGPAVDPGLLNPQTTLAGLTAALGPPSSVEVLEEAPEFQAVHYAFGLDVLLRDGRFSSALSYQP